MYINPTVKLTKIFGIKHQMTYQKKYILSTPYKIPLSNTLKIKQNAMERHTKIFVTHIAQLCITAYLSICTIHIRVCIVDSLYLCE